MDPDEARDKAVDVYLAEYSALRKETEFNLQAENTAVHYTILLLTALLASVMFVDKSKLGSAQSADLQVLALSVAPLMFVGIYMLLCKRHANSRRVARFVSDDLSELLRRTGVNDAFTWDWKKWQGEYSPSIDKPVRDEAFLRYLLAAFLSMDTLFWALSAPDWLSLVALFMLQLLFIVVILKKKAQQYLRKARWPAVALLVVALVSPVNLLWAAKDPSITSLSGFGWTPLVMGLIAAVLHWSGQGFARRWNAFTNHFYRWALTSLIPVGVCASAVYALSMPERSVPPGHSVMLLTLATFLTLATLLGAVATDAAFDQRMSKLRRSRELQAAMSKQRF